MPCLTSFVPSKAVKVAKRPGERADSTEHACRRPGQRPGGQARAPGPRAGPCRRPGHRGRAPRARTLLAERRPAARSRRALVALARPVARGPRVTRGPRVSGQGPAGEWPGTRGFGPAGPGAGTGATRARGQVAGKTWVARWITLASEPGTPRKTTVMSAPVPRSGWQTKVSAATLASDVAN